MNDVECLSNSDYVSRLKLYPKINYLMCVDVGLFIYTSINASGDLR